MVSEQFLSIGECALILGISCDTLRRWHKSHDFIPELILKSGHRRYSITQINNFIGKKAEPTPNDRLIVGYARVSSKSRKQDLKLQIDKIQNYCDNVYGKCTIISDLGSGMNFSKPGLTKLIKMLLEKKVQTLVINHKDRLLRFGFGLISMLCDFTNTKIQIIENYDRSDEMRLAEDVLEIITVFSSKLYGKRRNSKKTN